MRSDFLFTVIRHPLSPIHTLDNDSLLNIFWFCRRTAFEEDEYGDIRLGDLVGESWWYKLVQVCRRWRHLILGSAPYLRLALLCTRGTPIADMLLHSPPLPIVIDHDDIDHDLTAEDEEGILLALQNRNRVRDINLRIPVPSLQKLVMAIDGEFPILELLIIEPPEKQNARLYLSKHHNCATSGWPTLLLQSDLLFLQVPSDLSHSFFDGSIHPHMLNQNLFSEQFHSYLTWSNSR